MKMLIVNFAGLALIALVIWWFWIANSRDQKREKQ